MYKKVSIYIPTKNRLELLKRAVNSVLTQTVRNIELIVVSDGSNDGTCDYVRSIQSDISVLLIENKLSAGSCAARNQAIEMASGFFITGLDDDDYFMPNRIETFLREWEIREANATNFSALFDSCLIRDSKGVHEHNVATHVTSDQIVRANLIGSQVFTTRERFIGVGAFDAAMPAWQDWDLWVRLLKNYGPAFSISQLSYFVDERHEYARISNRPAEKIKAAAALFYSKYCNRNQLTDIVCALECYSQVKFTINDICRLLLAGKFRIAARKVAKGEFSFDFRGSVNARTTILA